MTNSELNKMKSEKAVAAQKVFDDIALTEYQACGCVWCQKEMSTDNQTTEED